MFSPGGDVKKMPKKKSNAANETQGFKVKRSKRVQSKLYDTDESVRNALLEILIYIVFLVVTTIVANASHHLYMFYFNQTIEKSFLERTSKTEFDSEVTFDQMVTAADWWIYLEKNFLEELHGEHSKTLGSSDDDEVKPKAEKKEDKKPEQEKEEEVKMDERKLTRFSDEDIESYKQQLSNVHQENDIKLQEVVQKLGGINTHEDTHIKESEKKYKREEDQKGENEKGDGDKIQLDHGPDKHDDDIEDKMKKDAHKRHIYLRDNIILGPPRLRQIRVKEGFCHIHKVFETYFKSCYAGYSKSIENRTKIYKKTQFYTRKQLKANRIGGQITTYSGAGYVRNLTFDHKHNIEIIKRLKEDEWIDRGTRLVVLEFVLFNTNAFMLNNVKIMAEILPVGGIVPSHHFQALKLHSIWTEGSYKLYIAGVLFYIMTVCYTVAEIIQLIRLGAKKYFKSIWNILDIIVLILAYLSLAYSIVHPLYLKRIMTNAKKNPENFVSIDYVCFWNLLFIDMMGICVFLVWIKIFKYISFNKTMLQFSTTLKTCAKDLFGFAVMFFIVFLAYAQLGVLIFGTSHPDFREFSTSVITLMRMFLGDFEYQLIEEANHILGPIYFLTYVLFVFFILLNMFLAIINDTYGAVKSEVSRGHSNLGSYLAKHLRRIFPFCFRKQRTTETSRIHSKPNDATHTTPAVYPSTTSGITHQSRSDRMPMSDSAVLREYFVEIPEGQQGTATSEMAIVNTNLKRLNNRITQLEKVLEQLINNMDRILQVVEAKKR